MHVEKNGSDEISGGDRIGSDTFQNGSDVIRYPTVILSPYAIKRCFLCLSDINRLFCETMSMIPSFLRNSVRYREVSAVKHVRNREFPM